MLYSDPVSIAIVITHIIQHNIGDPGFLNLIQQLIWFVNILQHTTDQKELGLVFCHTLLNAAVEFYVFIFKVFLSCFHELWLFDNAPL